MDLTCSVQAADKATVPPPVRRSGVLVWLAPDLAVLLALITVGWCLLLFDGTRTLFRDSDSGWHIRTGEAILDGRGLPRTDSFSLTRSGQPWFAWEWGADALMGAAHRAGGLAYVAGLYAVVLGACTWLWVRLNWAAGGHFLLAGLLAILMVTSSNIHLHARPHVFGWLFLIALVVYLESERRSLVGVALLGAVWANVHPSFFLLPVVAGIYALSRWVEPWVWIEPAEARRRLKPASPGWFLAAAVVGLAGTFLNPYGWHVHSHVLQYLANHELLARIGEFQTFNFHGEGAWQIVLTMGVAAAGAAAALAAGRPAHALLIGMLLAMGLRSARTLPVVALICLPLANGSITWALREWQGLQPGLRKWIDGFLEYGANLRRLETGFRGAVPAAAALVVIGYGLSLPDVQQRAGFPPDTFPVTAAAEVAKLPANARILAPDMFGGYLIYRFGGERKVFFDGRSDFYGVQYMKDYLKLIEVRPGWRDELAKTGFTHALLPNRYSLVSALESEGWTKRYSDDVATLLAAPRRN